MFPSHSAHVDRRWKLRCAAVCAVGVLVGVLALGAQGRVGAGAAIAHPVVSAAVAPATVTPTPAASPAHPAYAHAAIAQVRVRSGPAQHTVHGTAAHLAAADRAMAGEAVSTAARPVGWLHTSGSRIVTDTGATFTIKAVNWFGLETANCAPHGLWQVSLGSVLDQIHSWGFNTVRLPFANQCIDGAAPNSINYNLNPGLRGASAVQLIDAVVAGARARGMRVILDRHRPSDSNQSALWYTPQYPETVWIRDWVKLASRYRSDPTVIGVDLHNEPHGIACWGCGAPARDWAAAATRGANAVLSANPHLLVVIEGIENQSGTAGSTWWGGGLADVAAHPIRLAVAHQLVYSAHDYPSTVYAQKWFSAPNYPANLPSVWNANFGYLQRTATAPVFLGEFGTRLATTSDRQWLATLVTYLKASGFSFGYWSYNPDSGDTGGLVGDDWKTPQTAKLAALAPLLGASTAVAPVPAPVPTATVVPTSVPVVSWTLESSWAEGYVAQLTVTAPAGLPAWTVSWPDSFAHAIVNAWGLTCTTRSGTTRCAGSSWASTLNPGQTVTVGLQVDGSGTAPSHPPITLTAR